jgi:hypothetical protein
MSVNQLQQLVDDIQSCLASDIDPEPPRIQALETAYADALNEANKRLRECDQLLRAGHQTEAIQRCEIDPNLLDIVALLDFPEAEQWADYVVQFGLPAPPRLRVDIAGELNESYAKIEPLKELFRQHRLQALARSPLSGRIAILRQIAAMDETNPIWDEDVRAYERARHSQIRQDLSTAVQQRATATVAQLVQEVKSSEWREEPPKALVAQVVKAHKQLRVEEARHEIEQVSQELTKAFAALDIAKGRDLRDRFHALRPIANFPANEPLMEMTAPALEWVEKQDNQDRAEQEHHAAVAEIQRAVEEGADRGELESLEQEATREERRLPIELQNRLEERLVQLDSSARRRTLVVLAGIALFMVLIGSVAAVVVVGRLRSAEVTDRVKAFQELVSAGKLAEANQFLSDLEEQSSRVFNHPDVQKLKQDVDELQRQDDERQKNRAQAVRSAEKLGLTTTNLASLPQAEAELQRATDLSKGEAELLEVEKIKNRLAARRKLLQAKVDDDFKGRLDEMAARLQRLRPDDRAGMDLVLNDLRSLSQSPNVSPDLLQKADPLIAKAQTLLDSISENERRLERLIEITSKVRQPAPYLVALEEYIKLFPSERRSTNFRQIVDKEGTTMAGMQRWNTLIQDWGRIDFTAIKPADARTLIAESQKLIEEMPWNPARPKVEAIRKALEVTLQRTKEDGSPLHRDLDATLDHPLVKELYFIHTKKGQRFYGREAPTESGPNVWSFRCALNRDVLKRPHSKQFSADDLIRKDDNWQSPQWIFSRRAKDLLANIDHRGWEKTFCEIILNLNDDTEMEPVLKLQLLEAVVPVAVSGSQFFHDRLQDYLTIVKSASIDRSVNWLDPDDLEGKKARESAAEVLGRLPSLRDLSDGLKKYQADLQFPKIGPTFDWVGWIYRDADSKWVCAINKDAARTATGTLRTFFSSVNSGLTLDKIGTLRDGRAKVTVDLSSELAEGRPAFLDNSTVAPR